MSKELEVIKAMNIHERMHSIMSEIGSMTKDGENKFHKYSYASEAQYVKSIRPLLMKYRVTVTPSVLNLQPDPQNSELMHLTMQYIFTNIDNPTDRVVASMSGSGSDKGDKALYKAITGIKKYMIANTFMTVTGDDAEADEKTDERATTKTKIAPTLASSSATEMKPRTSSFRSTKSNGFGS